MGKVLNKHLKNSHQNTKPCHEWTVAELQEFQSKLFQHREESFDSIYREVSDTRAMLRSSVEEHEAHWAEMNSAAGSHPQLIKMQRDGHCQEAVMWWIHHLSEETKASMQDLTIPALPLVHWREPTAEEGADAAKLYKAHYHPSSTCLACHGGGMPWQDPDVQPAPLPRQVNNYDRIRRCDEWYGDEEGGACTPCEGMAGTYWGDLPDYMIPPECEELATPDQIPEDQRAPRQFPRMFAVEMRGADRWPRASPSANATCNFTTDCSPYDESKEGQPIPPGVVDAHWYSSIHGVLYVDHNEGGQYAGGLLRHETVYQFPAGREGAERSIAGRWGDRNVHLTELHVQTAEMGAVGDPGVMLNLVHQNMTATNESGVDDSKLDWRRIPSNPQADHDGCVCVPDPAGLPYFEHAFDNATYVGRVRFVPPWQVTGKDHAGPPDGVPVVADHYAKWNFHLFVDIETRMPTMFSSPYGGVATYGNWSNPDEMWPDWRDLPDRNNCFDVTKADSCVEWTKPKFMSV
jgi:hypothetical protein